MLLKILYLIRKKIFNSIPKTFFAINEKNDSTYVTKKITWIDCNFYALKIAPYRIVASKLMNYFYLVYCCLHQITLL